MVAEARLERGVHGLRPAGPGWFVLNAREAEWQDGPFGAYTPFENVEERFAELGINVAVLAPGQPNAYYHSENVQEDFLVLAGECLLIIEEQERHLRRWDFVHCPPRTRHILVGGGDRPCVLLGVGNRDRTDHAVHYPVSALARRYGAGVRRETDDPGTAYATAAPDLPVGYDPRWLSEESEASSSACRRQPWSPGSASAASGPQEPGA
jgi:uncharacterized cupin superfamily protein